MRFIIKVFSWILLTVLVVGVDAPLFAQVPPPSSAPIDGISGALAVIVIGAGLAARKYRNDKKEP